MKKIISFLFCLILSLPIVAGAGNIVVVKKKAASCPAGTYMFNWTGDYSGNSTTACKTDASGTVIGTNVGTVTISGDYGQSGNGAQMTGDGNKYIGWTVSSEDLINATTGTVWMSVYVATDALTAQTQIFEASSGFADYLKLTIGSSRRIQAYYRGDNAVQDLISPAVTGLIPLDAWTRIMFAWNVTTDYFKVCVDVDHDGVKDADECLEENNDLTIINPVPTQVALGENNGGTTTTEQSVKVDNVRILSTYDAADPGV